MTWWLIVVAVAFWSGYQHGRRVQIDRNIGDIEAVLNLVRGRVQPRDETTQREQHERLLR